MACHCILSSSFLPSLSFQPKFRRIRPSVHVTLPINCQLDSSEAEEESKSKKNILDILKISVTLTVVSASLPQPSLAAKVSKKKRPAKQVEALAPEDLKTWSQQLPVVTNRLPYTDILNLKREGKLKHIIKHPSACLKRQSEVVFAVLEDSKVFRVAVPTNASDKQFWELWDELNVDSICVNAYTPPLEKPGLPRPFLGAFFDKLIGADKVRVEPDTVSVERDTVRVERKPQSKRILELQRIREELKRSRTNEVGRLKKEKELVEKAARAQRARKRLEERKRKKELRRINARESWNRARQRDKAMAAFWGGLARNQNFTTFLGFVFFFIFYQTVVLSYKKQKKDYDDRIKIERADAEERRKMRMIEQEIMGIGDEDIREEGEQEGGEREENDHMKKAKQFMKSGARVRLARNKGVPQYFEGIMDVKFSDVAGLGKIRFELEEIVKFFTHGEMYRRRGIKIPGGVLLCGPPGVGKTLLAKAVAGEAGVNFFSISASQFVEIYVGVGASRVRALYQEAREMAPSVVFIDELDAVGRERGLIKGSGGQERDATLNQLLVCLDGFEGRGDVITIASTNRPEILDPALVRPGRFDRKIFIPKPGLIGRAEILKVHARKKPMAEDVDYMAVAGVTTGMVGAELANLFEVSAINMMREKRTEITTDDLIQAAQIEERGMLEKKDRSPEMWKRIAINEGSTAVVAVNFRDLRNIEFITINPRAGRELGYVRPKMDSVTFKTGMLSRQCFLDYITVQLAPRAADEIWFGEDQLSTLWAEAGENARSGARGFVLAGLTKKHYGLSNFWLTDRIDDIDTEALQILNMCYERAKEILQQNRKLMEAVVDQLVEKKSMTKQELFTLVELHGSLEPFPASIIDIRAAKRSQFQGTMMHQKEATV